ncbi:MAG: flagellar hook-length control protein FliK [Mariprofundaceae bacterium]
MLEQLQTGASTEAALSAAQKDTKAGKEGLFANLFAALTHKKGSALKGQIAKIGTAVDAEKGDALKSALTSTPGKADGLQHAKLPQLTIGEAENNKKTARQKEAQTHLTKPAKQQKAEKENNLNAILLPLAAVPVVAEKTPSIKTDKITAQLTAQTAGKTTGKNNTHENMVVLSKQQPNAEAVAETKPLISAGNGKVDVATGHAHPATDAEKSGLSNIVRATANSETSPGIKQNSNRPAAHRPNGDTSSNTASTISSEKGDNRVINELLRREMEQQDKLQSIRLQHDQNARTDKNQKDTQASMGQRSVGSHAGVGRSEHGQRGAASSSTANSSTGQTAQISLLNQPAGQSADMQNGNEQFSSSRGNHAMSDLNTRQDAADSRFSGLLQTEARPPNGFDANQLAARPTHPVKALEAMQQIAQSARDGITRLELQLEPAHLGKVHISLQTDAAKQLQMHLTVEHGMTRQVIEQHMPQLRTALEQQGLSLDQFSLQTGSQQQHAQDQSSSAQMNSQHQQSDAAAEQSNMPIDIQAAAHGRLSIHV